MNYSENTRSFFQDVFEVVQLIPEGRVSSYGAIAKYLGSGKSARMVGWAMHASFSAEKYVPAHRVVNSQGLLTGRMHFESPFAMQELLEKEGLTVKNNQVQKFQQYLWDPAIELSIE
ncbi:MAG: MGMT family protein [Flavobacteriales bacterium]